MGGAVRDSAEVLERMSTQAAMCMIFIWHAPHSTSVAGGAEHLAGGFDWLGACKLSPLAVARKARKMPFRIPRINFLGSFEWHYERLA